MKLLIAEDDSISRSLLKSVMKKNGFDVVIARDGDEAWSILNQKEAPRLALLDWMMPGMDGLSLCRRIREREGGGYVYIILLTARDRIEDMADGLDAGADDYVTKPYNARELLARIKVGKRILDLQNCLQRHLDQLKELDHLKSDFISTVSHELRTPIAIMREAVSLVIDGLVGDISEDQRDLLNDALENIDRLTRLVTDLLDVSKIEAGKLKLRRSMMEVRELIGKVMKGYERQAKERNIQLTSHISEERLQIYADSDKITQILDNLLNNAFRFTPEGGRVSIMVYDRGSEIEFRVADTGIGISNENITKLFSKFAQFGRVDGPGYKGTGLGLVIVKGLVEKHGGRIWVTSKRGRGTTFYFTVQKVETPKILVVDDEEDIIELVKESLNVDDYRFVTARDGREALRKARSESPALIVLDMKLPKMDGYQVLEKLNENKKTQNTPVLLMSAFQLDESRLIRSLSGEVPFLNKPLQPEELRYHVQTMLDY